MSAEYVWLYELEKAAIVIVALIMAYAELAQAAKYRRSWIKWSLGFMGLYWAAYYTYSIIQALTDLRLPSHQVFVRSGILLTLALVGAHAFMTLKALKRFDK